MTCIEKPLPGASSKEWETYISFINSNTKNQTCSRGIKHNSITSQKRKTTGNSSNPANKPLNAHNTGVPSAKETVKKFTFSIIETESNSSELSHDLDSPMGDKEKIEATLKEQINRPKRMPNVTFNSGEWFKALVEIQRPVSEKRAQEIRRKFNMNPILIKEPLIGNEGFEVILFIGYIVPQTRLIASALTFLIALSKGNKVEAVLAIMPIPTKGIGKYISKMPKPVRGIVKPIVELPLVYYKKIAKKILAGRAGISYRKVLNKMKDITNNIEKKAVADGIEVYKNELKKTGDPRKAAAKAGRKYHESIGAAGPGEGVDYLYNKNTSIGEVKTHWFNSLYDETLNWSHEQMLAYILKNGVEGKIIKSAKVQHVFINIKDGKAKELIIEPFSEKELAGIATLIEKSLK